jgi:peptidyl-prolyl cis-trans isomerase B (cyclophilin B)
VSKKQHQKQVERARARRRAQVFERRKRRQRVIVLVMVGLMALSLVAVGLVDLLRDDPTPVVDDADGQAAGDDAQDDVAATADAPCPPPGDQQVPEPVTEPYDEPPRFELDEGADYRVRLSTTCGDIVVGLDAEGAPRTVENFLALTADGYYEGTPFHRTIAGFMIQGGDPTGTGSGCVDAGCEIRLPGYSFEDELETAAALPEHEQPGLVVYPRGVVAMANSGPDTQGSQYFLMHEDSPLPPDYTVFGEVLEGLEVVDDIAAGPVDGDQAIDPAVVVEVDIEVG